MWYVAKLTLTISWALWTGGIVAVFAAVTAVFKTFQPDRVTAGRAGMAIFGAFEAYLLLVIPIAILSAGVLLNLRQRRAAPLLGALVLAAVLGAVSVMLISPRIVRMQHEGQTQTPEFRRAHGISMMLYTCQGVLLLIGGLFLPAVLRDQQALPPHRDTTGTTAQA